jgi:hypothetical protein
MPTLQKGPKTAKKHPLAKTAPFDTLESIAKKNLVKDGWETLALYLFGTKEADEVNRALGETIGVAKVDLVHAEKTQLKPMTGHSGEIALPEDWTEATFEAGKRYRLTVARSRAPTAIAITNLDKWFIPGKETNDIRYTTEGDPESANLVDFAIYGSNYCECTDWNNGLGKYKILEGEQIFKEEGMKTMERGNHVLQVADSDGKKNGWSGLANTTKGILAVKADGKPRFINVAFSPYTVHFRYRKGGEDKTALLLLEPFWPQWDETKTEPAVTAVFTASPATFQWTNAADQELGVLEVTDATGQRVHLAVLSGDALAKGAKSVTWDKNYREDAFNGKFGQTYLDDSAEVTPLKKLLFKSTPYKAKVTTFVRKAKTDSLKIKWEIKETTKLDRGLLIVTDKDDTVVFQTPLPKGKMGKQKHEFVWDGKYLPGVKNSRAKKTDAPNTVYEAIPESMPYRVQVQAHTAENTLNGLALAAMHTEVRLFVHPKTEVPNALAYDPLKAEPSLALGQADWVPGDPPVEADGTKWFRHKLAQYGFHPGVVTDKAAANAEYKLALKEFKRSVPADGSAVAPNFTRLTIDDAEDAALKTAITTLRPGDKRKPFGDPTRVRANNNDPDLTEAEIDQRLPDPKAEMIVWVDDRQYYTQGDAKDDANNSFLSGTPSADAFGLKNYRGAMSTADGRATSDAAAIARPWIPLKTKLFLLSRFQDLSGRKRGDPETAPVALPDEYLAAMQTAIGPLRVDWTFEDLPPDVSVIDPAHYDAKFTRARKYVAWALRENKGTHTRKDTKREAIYTNCKETFGGIRPTALGDYYKTAFGAGDVSLAPWPATAVAETESVATIVHDHLIASQGTAKQLFKPLIGQAGICFHPSRIAGDGYRVRAEVSFEKFTGYEFPNLEALKVRYPISPQAHSAGLRVWRRSSVRGYMCWSAAATGHWPGMLDGMRDRYRPAHLYFVHEGSTAPRSFNVTDVFDPAQPTHATRFKNTIKNNVAASLQDVTKMSLKGNHVWPWSDRDDFGWPWISPVNLADNQVYEKWEMGPIMNNTWRAYRIGLLLALTKQVERLGVMRGHVFVEFDSSPAYNIQRYRCDSVPPHTYWIMQKDGVTNRRPNGPCPAPGCAGTLTARNAFFNRTSMPMPAVGGALGATWLFTTSDADTWAHEVGHHRHLEHAASAPGSQYDPNHDPTDPPNNAELHDAKDNTTQNWVTLGVAKPSEQDWDRNCIMSYASVYYAGGIDHFCGKCILRNRGWKVQTLLYPETDVVEPVP